MTTSNFQEELFVLFLTSFDCVHLAAPSLFTLANSASSQWSCRADGSGCPTVDSPLPALPCPQSVTHQMWVKKIFALISTFNFLADTMHNVTEYDISVRYLSRFLLVDEAPNSSYTSWLAALVFFKGVFLMSHLCCWFEEVMLAGGRARWRPLQTGVEL